MALGMGRANVDIHTSLRALTTGGFFHLIDSFKALGTDLGTVQSLVQHLCDRNKFYEHHDSDTESDAINQGDDGSLRCVAWQCQGGTAFCVANHHPVMIHEVGGTA